MGNLKFNGVATEDLGLVVQTPPVYTFPERDVDTEHVPGRNGDLVIDNGCYNNVTREYSLAIKFMPGTGFISNSEKITTWLKSTSGYARLEDSYDPDVYRLARFSSDGSLTNLYDKATFLTVQFECKPQRFLKKGELALTFKTSSASIKNSSQYTALPLITISGIPDTSDYIVLMEVKNSLSDSYAAITFSNLESGTVTIDSENQTVYNGTEDLNLYVNLNGNEFPKLKEGENVVTLGKYEEQNGFISAYTNILTNNYTKCVSSYKSYDNLITENESAFNIISYESLIESLEEDYTAEAYSLYCQSNGESYEFESFNTTLSSTAQVVGFTGTAADNSGAFPTWLTATDNTETVTYKANVDGYFRDSNGTKILHLTAGNEICTNKTTASTTIYYYPQDGSGKLAAEVEAYAAAPAWIKPVVTYDTTDGHPTKISYVVQQDGFIYCIYGLLSKYSWQYHTAASAVALHSATWSTSKKAFSGGPNGWSSSTTSTFPYIYFSSIANMQYKDVTEDSKDSNGNTVTIVTNAVHFIVKSSISYAEGDTLSGLLFEAKTTGYYKCNDNTAWKKVIAGQNITDAGTDPTSANTIYYFADENPSYASQTDFPEWLTPTPIINSGTAMNPTSISWQVLKDGYYRYTSINSSKEVVCGSWDHLNAGNTLQTAKSNSEAYEIDYINELPNTFAHDRAFKINDDEYTGTAPSWLNVKYVYTSDYISSIAALTSPVTSEQWNKYFADEDLDTGTFIKYVLDSAVTLGILTYSNDTWYTSKGTAITVSSGFTTSLSEGWFNQSLIDKLLADFEAHESSDVIAIDTKAEYSIEYYAKIAGYFKWDSNTVWVYLTPGSKMLSSDSEDETTLYYLAELPEYETYAMSDLFSLKISKSSTGNPNMVTYIIKVAGYYRCNDQTDWTYYDIGDTLLESATDTSNTIYHLNNTGEQLAGVTITIIPRWWML